MGHDIKTIRQGFKERGVFYTDPTLATLLKSRMPEDIEEIYDPTCGDGALLSVFGDDVRKYGQEIDPTQAEAARTRLINCEIATGDTLAAPAFQGHKFRAIVGNPPFSIKWYPDATEGDERFSDAPCLAPQSRADFAFLCHILHYLSDDGVAAVLEFPGVLYRGSREGKIREWMVRSNFIDEVARIEKGHFVDTNIETCLLVFRKNRKTNTVRFTDNETQISRDVPFEEIEANGFNLSVSSYVSKPEPEKEEIDPWEEERQGWESFVRLTESRIQLSEMVARIEGWSIIGFLLDLKKVIDTHLAKNGEICTESIKQESI